MTYAKSQTADIALVPHQVLVAHEGRASARQARQAEEFLKTILGNEAPTAPKDSDPPTSRGAE